MRILHLLNHAQTIGNGIVNVAIDLACLQSQAGHEVSVAAGQPVCKNACIKTYRPLLAHYGVQYFALEQKRTASGLFLASRHYRAIVQSFQPDIVHVHMMTGLVLAKVLRQKNAYQLISTVHNEFQRSAVLMGLADQVIAVSQSVEDSMRRRGIPYHKLQTIHNATIGSPRQPEAVYSPMPLKHPAITTIAGLYPRKGIDLLIEAFTQAATVLATAHLYIVGEGPMRASLEAQIRASPVSERIHLEGFQREPQRYLEATDLFVLASRKEPFGLVLSEARAAGCAILATQVDGIPEALDQGAAGLLVKPNDSEAIAAALIQLLSDPVYLAQWQQKAKQNLEHLHVERMNQETLALYGAVLKKEGLWKDIADVEVRSANTCKQTTKKQS